MYNFCFADNESNEVTVHGYFNLNAKQRTQLDFSNKYDKNKMKWIRFICFEPGSPQQRAWFIPIKGLAFGQPRHLFPRNQIEEKVKSGNYALNLCTVPSLIIHCLSSTLPTQKPEHI